MSLLKGSNSSSNSNSALFTTCLFIGDHRIEFPMGETGFVYRKMGVHIVCKNKPFPGVRSMFPIFEAT